MYVMRETCTAQTRYRSMSSCRIASCIVRPVSPLLPTCLPYSHASTHAHAARRQTQAIPGAQTGIDMHNEPCSRASKTMALLHALFPLFLCSVCLSRPHRRIGSTASQKVKTPSTHHLGRRSANTHICRPLIETRPSQSNRAIRPARQYHRWDPQPKSYHTLALLRPVSTSHNNAHLHALAGEERHAPVSSQSALVTQPRLFFRTRLHCVRPVWSGATPTPDKRVGINMSLTES